MKKIIHRNLLLGTVLASLFLTGCSDVLDEQPRSNYDPTFFTTRIGVEGGVTSMYAHLRYIYGGYYYTALEHGTDEYTVGNVGDGNNKAMDLSITSDGQPVGTLTNSSSRSDVLWVNSFSNINTASGVIENGGAAGVSDALIAEARFFRAYDYFQLVQTFGGVPLDLGSGELKFNSTPSRTSVRNTVPEVYTKAIFPDLKLAVEQLPETPRRTGTVTKTTARFFLAKAYLTYAWWLENPGDIPTYPETPRNDPDGKSAAQYYQLAYDTALEGIANPGPYGLQPTYYDVHLGSNDRNSEVLLYADHTETSEFYNGASFSYEDPGKAGNCIVWFVTCNYQDLGGGLLQREVAQAFGRPWTRMAPPIGVFENTFADKTNDSRFDGTFVTVWRANWAKGTDKSETKTAANGLPVRMGDAVLSFLPAEECEGLTYGSSVGGTIPGRADYIISLANYNNKYYPGLWKIGPYRTDNNGGLGQPNAPSTRPWNLAYFSDFFLTAAEAAVKGATTKAVSGIYANDGTPRGLVNIIRARAGKWRWNNNGNKEKTEDNSAAMTAATPATITIDYILAERSREYFGEGVRWFDLVRTQKWAEVAGTFKIAGRIQGSTPSTDHMVQTYERKIEKWHYLRPIPTGQLNALEGDEAYKKAYQNPGYN